MASIELTKTAHTLIDDNDYEWLNKKRWYLKKDINGGLYAVDVYHIPMHRYILDLWRTSYPLVDHIDGDGLNNQRDNLRVCDHVGNAQNRRKSTKNPTHSKYKGVSKNRTKWVAYIKVNRKLITLGRFDNEEDAARAYDSAAKKYFGEFARTNF